MEIFVFMVLLCHSYVCKVTTMIKRVITNDKDTLEKRYTLT